MNFRKITRVVRLIKKVCLLNRTQQNLRHKYSHLEKIIEFNHVPVNGVPPLKNLSISCLVWRQKKIVLQFILCELFEPIVRYKNLYFFASRKKVESIFSLFVSNAKKRSCERF